ncbi:undecaprenyl diphosphate synthase family protein, partial [Klebsiella quasipneumoniae]|uniref:undecaprenyl diphosphate synthase family protein n=1 Tax=Klebsiella quasipneumoniae TaxID=1463165 RepID=UPI002731CEF8
MIKAEAIDEALLEKELSTFVSRAPHIDLLIRTGGRLRVSDFLMWHIAQAELYFTDILAPDFGEIEFIEALCSFQKRE